MTVNPLLIYPENRELAFSNLAVHWFFNAFEKYSPDILTLDSEVGIINGVRLSNSPFVFVSVSYGLSFINFTEMLKRHGIPLLKKDRQNGMFPIFIAGGIAVMLNPEPLTQIFDAVFTGEGECMEEDIKKMFEMETREEVLFFIENLKYAMTDEKKYSEYVYAEKGTFAVHSVSSLQKYGNCFHNRMIIEMGRGCTNRCKFCAASYAYKTFREADRTKMLELADQSIKEKKGLALMGTSLASVSCFDEILEKCAESSIPVSLSSLKVVEITPLRMALLKKCNVRSVTVAIESASYETREKILKVLKDDDIIKAMAILKKHDIKSKIYLIAGLPGTDAGQEARAVVALMKKLDDENLLNETTISVAPFAPKPFTPYENEKMMTKKEYKLYMDVIRKGLVELKSKVKAEFFSYKDSVIDVLFGQLKGDDFIKLMQEDHNKGVN